MYNLKFLSPFILYMLQNFSTFFSYSPLNILSRLCYVNIQEISFAFSLLFFTTTFSIVIDATQFQFSEILIGKIQLSFPVLYFLPSEPVGLLAHLDPLLSGADFPQKSSDDLLFL